MVTRFGDVCRTAGMNNNRGLGGGPLTACNSGLHVVHEVVVVVLRSVGEGEAFGGGRSPVRRGRSGRDEVEGGGINLRFCRGPGSRTRG